MISDALSDGRWILITVKEEAYRPVDLSMNLDRAESVQDGFLACLASILSPESWTQ